jgi:hypothetical protein
MAQTIPLICSWKDGSSTVQLLLTQTFEPFKACARELLINTGRIETPFPALAGCSAVSLAGSM